MNTKNHCHWSSALQMLVAGMFVCGSCLSSGCAGPAKQDASKLADFFKTSEAKTPKFKSPELKKPKFDTPKLKAPEWTKKMPWSKSDEDELPEPYPNPVKLAMTWTPDVLVQPGRTPTRGFGGRLFFFDEKSKAVPVEGELTVHGFEGEASHEKTKIRPFKFTAEQFTQHFSQSDFGASYSIWIPWDPAGGEQKRVSLVATFESSAGAIVQGQPTTIILPGTTEQQEEEHVATILSPQYRNHRDAINQQMTRPSRLATTTIRRRIGGAKVETETSIANRLEAIAAKQHMNLGNGKTPFIDVPTLAPTPTVMKASAEIPQESRPRRIPTGSH